MSLFERLRVGHNYHILYLCLLCLLFFSPPGQAFYRPLALSRSFARKRVSACDMKASPAGPSCEERKNESSARFEFKLEFNSPRVISRPVINAGVFSDEPIRAARRDIFDPRNARASAQGRKTHGAGWRGKLDRKFTHTWRALHLNSFREEESARRRRRRRRWLRALKYKFRAIPLSAALSASSPACLPRARTCVTEINYRASWPGAHSVPTAIVVNATR